MDSPWTHALCLPCWGELEPDRPPPAQFAEEHRELEICCRCAQQTDAGIYYRAAPLTLACLGRHAAAELEHQAAELPRLGDFILPTPGLAELRGPFQPYLPTMPGMLFELGGGISPARPRRPRLWDRIRHWFTYPPAER